MKLAWWTRMPICSRYDAPYRQQCRAGNIALEREHFNSAPIQLPQTGALLLKIPAAWPLFIKISEMHCHHITGQKPSISPWSNLTLNSVCIVHSSLPLPSAVGRGYSPSWDLFVFCVSLMLDCPSLKRFPLCLLDNPGSILEWSETYITGVFTSFFFFSRNKLDSF